jgi:DNA-binding transcriptional ArsR family regulator
VSRRSQGPAAKFASTTSRRRQDPSARGKARHAECEVSCVDIARTTRARKALPDPFAINALAETLKALGDPTRLRIVTALGVPGVDELCVCDLASLVGVSQSAVSHSLRVLRDLHLVRYRKVGKIAFYALDDAHVGSLLREGFRHVGEQAALEASA